MSFTQFWVGMLVPPIIKWANPIIKRFFNLPEFDSQIQERVTNKQYPFFFPLLYGLWIITLLSTGIVVLLLIFYSFPYLFPDKDFAISALVGFIQMIGAWFIFGAIFDALFWGISSDNFRDYVMFRQLKSGWGYDIKRQIITLFKIGIIYYLVTSPLVAYLLLV